MPDDDDTLIEALLEVMDHHPDGDDAPPYSFIDGALAGLLIVGGVPPEEWLPKLKAGPDGGFADPAMGERFAQLLLDRQAGMAAEMLDDESGLDAVYELDDREEPIWQIWLAGLGTALGAQGDQLAAAIESDDEDMATAWSGLIALLGSLPGLSGKLEEAVDKDDLEELTAIAPDIIPYFVETIYRRQRGLPRIVMGDDWDVEDVNPAQQPRHVEKIGRNDPCPCGSGKKFKKCCGG